MKSDSLNHHDKPTFHTCKLSMNNIIMVFYSLSGQTSCYDQLPWMLTENEEVEYYYKVIKGKPFPKTVIDRNIC